jgi:malate dehydrogenase
VEEVFGLGDLSSYEEAGLKALIPELRESIEKGTLFANEAGGQ